MYSRINPSPEPSEFPQINPFADQLPFFLFYDGDGPRRIYHVAGLGRVTRDLFQATRFEIHSYANDIGRTGVGQDTPRYVTIPVCAYQANQNSEVEFYAGNHRIQLDPACGKSIIHQAACGAKRLARPAFRPGGPFGAVVQTAKHTPGDVLHVAYFNIDLLFYPQGNARIPDILEGFNRIGINHFTSIPRYW